MCNVLHYIRRMSESRLRWARARGILFAVGLAASICCGLTVQFSRAQEGSQSGNTEGSAQTSAPSSDTQAPSSAGSGAEGTSQGQSQSGNAEGTDETAAPNSELQAPVQAPIQAGATNAPSSQDGSARTPAQSGRPQASGTRATTPRSNSEIHQTGPQEIQQPSPYGNMPSLQELYTQIPSGGGGLQRFGSDAFLLGTGNANELPMDLPVGPDYVLGPGDSLVVNMWGGQSSRLDRVIDRQGQIELPEAGTVMISGMTIAQAQSVDPTSLEHTVSE